MSSRRRARELHELVEKRTPASAAPSYAPLLEVVGALREVPVVRADPDFVARLRAELMAEAAVVLAPSTTGSDSLDARLRLPRLDPADRRRHRRHRRIAAGVSAAALVGAAATMAVASQSSLPGDGLYPVKRGIESAHVQLTFGQGAQGRLLLSDASTRLDEVDQLAQRAQAAASSSDSGSPSTSGSTSSGSSKSSTKGSTKGPTKAKVVDPASAAHINEALSAFNDEAVRGSDLLVADFRASGDRSSITDVRRFTAQSMARLHTLQRSLPAGTSTQLLEASQTLDQIQQVSIQACAACDGPMITQVPQVLTTALALTSATTASGGLDPVFHSGGHHQSTGGNPDGNTGDNPGGNLPGGGTTTSPTSVTGIDSTTVQDLRHTVTGLTHGLTDGQPDLQNLTDTTVDLLDSVTGTDLDTTLGNLQSALPTLLPSLLPTLLPSGLPTLIPTQLPTLIPTALPTALPTQLPSGLPTNLPSNLPSNLPTTLPSNLPTTLPSNLPTSLPTQVTLPTLLP